MAEEAPPEEEKRQENWSIWARQFLPALFICLREGYSLQSFGKDVLAGMVLAFLALPLNMAFAIACGLPPEYGLYTAIVAGALAAMFGGTPVSIGGPTGSFVVIIYTLLNQYGYAGVATATCMAGVILLVMAFMGCGKLLQLVSYPVIRGFTSGIAIVIMGMQVRDFLGLYPTPLTSSHFVSTCLSNWDCLAEYNPIAVTLGTSCLIFLMLMRAYFPRFPALPVVVIVSAAITALFALPIETIGTRFGAIPDGLPAPSLAMLDWQAIPALFPPAFTIAMLCALESLLCAMVADEMAGTRHNSNAELMGQGIANIGSVLFHGIPSAGAIGRTATNIRMGAQTPVSSLVHAGVMLMVVMFFAHFAEKIPLTALAAMLLVVSWQMSEFGRLRGLLNGPKEELIIFFMTFFLTIFVDLTVAIEVGVLLSMFFFIQQLRDHSSFKAYQTVLKDPERPALRISQGKGVKENKREKKKSIEFLTLHGPLFFGTADILQEAQKQIREGESRVNGAIWIICMKAVPFIDASGAQALFELQATCKRNKVHLLLAEVNPSVRKAIQQADHEGHFSEKMIFNHFHEAQEEANRLV